MQSLPGRLHATPICWLETFKRVYVCVINPKARFVNSPSLNINKLKVLTLEINILRVDLLFNIAAYYIPLRILT